MIAVIAIMIGAGFFGGWINYLLLDAEQQTGAKQWFRCVVVGTGASLLIPLFLNTISSTLVNSVLQATTLTNDALVLVGFCLVAAIVSQQFIKAVSDSLLQKIKQNENKTKELSADIKNVEQKVGDAKSELDKELLKVNKEVQQKTGELHGTLQEVEQAVEAIKEPEEGATALSSIDLGALDELATVAAETPKEEVALLKSIGDSKFPLRSLSGIASQTGNSTEAAAEKLELLEKRGLVTRVHGKSGERWGLTSLAVRLVKKN